MEEAIHNQNRLLRRKLNSLLKQARTNEKKQELFDSFGFEIISASTPAQLRDLILYQMKTRFQLQEIVLCLVDFDKDTDRLFYGHDEESRVLYGNNLIIIDEIKQRNLVDSLTFTPQLGPKVLLQYEWLIEKLDNRSDFNSAALLPLIRSERVIGALLLVSGDTDRYQAGHGTEFLQKLSAMTAVAIENCLNQQRLKEIGYQDALTQAYNRRYFDLRFRDEIERSIRQESDLTCMFLDVDFFKKVNDTYGHHIGDLVLMKMVSIIKEHVRASDIVARYGGEEFAVALPSTDLEISREIAERLRIAVYNETHCFHDKELKISISIGMSSLRLLNQDERVDADSIAVNLLNHADSALYCAKKNGRNQVVVYSSSEGCSSA